MFIRSSDFRSLDSIGCGAPLCVSVPDLFVYGVEERGCEAFGCSSDGGDCCGVNWEVIGGFDCWKRGGRGRGGGGRGGLGVGVAHFWRIRDEVK